MDSRQRNRRNEIYNHPRNVPGCQLAKMSLENQVDPGCCCNSHSNHRTLQDQRRKAFHHNLSMVQMRGSMSHCTASTASLSVSDSECGGDSTDLRRVYLAEEGESIESICSTSTSLVEDEYWRLNYVSMKDDNSSGTASTKFSTPMYYRPVDSFERKPSSNSCAASLRLPPNAVSALTTCNHSDEMSAVTFNCSFSEDGHPTGGSVLRHKTLARSPRRNVEKTNSWTDDDSEIKRMESITHTFQRSSSMTSSYQKISAPPLSGIGVEVSRSASFQQDYIPTPRAAANVSCSLSSIMGEILGVTQPDEHVNSSRRGLFSGFKTMLCNSGVAHNTSISNMKSKYDADDWSFDVNSQTDELRGASDDYDDDKSESYVGSHNLRDGGYVRRRRNRPHQSTQCRRATSRIDESVVGPSRRHRATQFSCNNDESDYCRKFQDSPYVRSTAKKGGR